MGKLSPSMNDQLLTGLLRQRDKEAFKLLFDRYAVSLYGLILDIVGHPESASQTLQTTFKAAYETFDEYDPAKHQLFTWLMQLARHHAIQLLPSISAPSAIELSGKETGLRSLLRHIPTQQRLVIELMYYHGHNKQQVGEILNLDPEALASFFSAGMQVIREHLSKIQQVKV